MPVAVAVALQIGEAVAPFLLQAAAAIQKLIAQKDADHLQVLAELGTAAGAMATAIAGIPARLAANDAKIDAEIASK